MHACTGGEIGLRKFLEVSLFAFLARLPLSVCLS